MLQIYYPSLSAIHQRTRQLENECCLHCQQPHQLVSHGYIRKKRVGGDPAAVGKRVFCSNRHRRTGCGRTVQLYLDSTLRRLHYAAWRMAAFVLAIIQGMSIPRAYLHATGVSCPRNAYRWFGRLETQLSVYRSLTHQPPLSSHPPPDATSRRPLRLSLLISTFDAMARESGQAFCAHFQRRWQRAFLA